MKYHWMVLIYYDMVWNIIFYHYSIYYRNKICTDLFNWLFSAIFRNTIYRDVYNWWFSVGFRTLGHLENTSNCFYWLFEYWNQSDLMFRRSGLGIQLSFRNDILMDQSYHIIYFFGLFFRSSSSKLAFLLRKHRFSKVFSSGAVIQPWLIYWVRTHMYTVTCGAFHGGK